MLTQDATKKVFLMLNNLRVHYSQPVKKWVEERKRQNRVILLAQLQPGAQPGREAQRRLEVRYLFKGSGTQQEQAESRCNR